ncbi:MULTISPECIES: LacI family DNA-binding transcriptional regulator [Microbacterium]|jgi:DNA-binding LacI/PurR family transcriptional regulator|uniref:LacI family DNA-binding transcriptional regulator n=1 Tax=Microbacterium TaxID=33882 RepID=UPI000B864B02|nr:MULTISPECIES: LacI family DNA-binding transcriptional regulator [Microbacterium]MDF2558721.1 transcriptional regulator,LacI family protein [Microbacterium sp.]NJI60228.1 LacI family transcriptional regulator [Microbacterium sp. B19(2022)]
MAATLHDVANLAGVSIKTVSNVVNDYPHVKESTRTRVRQAIEELNYQPNLSARSLRSGRSGVIGLVLPELSLSYFGELADAVIAEAERHGLVVLIEKTGADRDREIAVLTSPRMQLTDGLIFSPLGMGQADAQHFEVDFPVVLLGERIFGGPVDHVTMRNVEAAQAATELLLQAGRRRIALVGAHVDEDVGSAALRTQGYEQALAAAGIEVDQSLVRYTTLWHRSNGAEAIRDLLNDGVEFDAVFGLNDALALGAMRALQEAGLRIPDDVSVVGFDDIDEAQYTLPSLSTINPGREQIAALAVELLLTRIRDGGGRPSDPREVLVDFEVVVRESAVPSD